VSGWEYRTAGIDVPPPPVGFKRSWQVDCPAGKKPLGGGVSTTAPSHTLVEETAPATTSSGQATGWRVSVRNEGPSRLSAYAWVICAVVN
jgi:hypothetical protein